jgi:macrodomain Ter protein organizer (MatP/YcbG family)
MQALETLNTLNKTRLVKLSLIFKVHYNTIKRCTRYIKVDLGFFLWSKFPKLSGEKAILISD